MARDREVSDLMLPLWEEVLWLFLDVGIVCVFAQPLSSGTSQGGTGRTASSSSSCWREREAPSIRPHGELLLLVMQKKPTLVPDSEAFNSFVGVGFLIPELKGGSEVSEDDQADNVSNEALYIIGGHGSGDKISRYLQDWEVAQVALSCHTAFDMLCQELYEVERRRGWFGF